MVLLALFGLTLLSQSLADRLTRPLVALGALLSNQAGGASAVSIVPSLLLGVATGLLWAPCAGPILGLVLTGAAIKGASASPPCCCWPMRWARPPRWRLALLIGGRVFAAMKRRWAPANGSAAPGVCWCWQASPPSPWAGHRPSHPAVAGRTDDRAIAAGPTCGSGRQDRRDVGRWPGSNLPVGRQMPALNGAVAWLNSPPLTREALRGKVVLVDFWTYSCINCLRALPYVEAWASKYKDHGLVVIGVHAPEFAFEKERGNVRRAVTDLGVTYPVALDNNYAIWQAFNNQYWPAHYFIDAQGASALTISAKANTTNPSSVIQQLLTEAGCSDRLPADASDARRQGTRPRRYRGTSRSPETYVGYERAGHFASAGESLQDRRRLIAAPPALH